MIIRNKDRLLGILLIISAVIVVTFSAGFASAIIGKIGNGIMIIDAEVGDTVERSVLVINDNEIPVTISVFASGDLEKDVKILDDEFTLEPGEEKKARFTIRIRQPGTTTTRINVQFTPIDSSPSGNESKSGMGLSSKVTIHAVGEGELVEEEEETGNGEENTEEETGGITGDNVIDLWEGNNKIFFLGGTSVILLIVLIALLSSLSKKKINVTSNINVTNKAENRINSKKKTKKEDEE